MPLQNPPDITGSPYQTKPGDSAYAVAKQQVGKPYIYNTVGPASFDCSSLMQYSYQNGPGIAIGRDTSAQWNNSTTLTTIWDFLTQGPFDASKCQLETGDLVLYFQPGNSGENAHVRMVNDHGSMIEAPYTGLNVRDDQPLDMKGDAAEPFRGVKRATGGGSTTGPAGSASGGNNNSNQSSGKGTSSNSISNNPGQADTGFITQPLTDPRNNLPMSPLFQGSHGFVYRPPQGSTIKPNLRLLRGGIVQLAVQDPSTYKLTFQKGGQFACFFMMNPSSIATDCTINTDQLSPSQTSAAAMQAAPSWLAQQTINFTIIFNRMYEVWQGTMKGPNGGPGPADIGVRWDVRAIERLMGMFDAQALNTAKGVNNVGLGTSGAGSSPPSSLPVQVVFGGPNSIQFQGYIAAMDYTYTMFDSNMVPVECTVDISILRQYLPMMSSADLVNPLVTQMGQLGQPTFPWAPNSTFNAKTGVVEVHRKGGISL